MAPLAVTCAAELVRFGIDTTIVVPGSFTTGANHFANAGHAADEQTAQSYDEHYAGLMEQVAQRLGELAPDDLPLARPRRRGDLLDPAHRGDHGPDPAGEHRVGRDQRVGASHPSARSNGPLASPDVSIHVLEPSPDTVTTCFSRRQSPVLTVEPGDELRIRSLDVLAHLERFEGDDRGVPRLLGPEAGLTVVGPIAVRGARPGMAVALTVVDLEPHDFGWTMSSWQHSDLERGLEAERDEPTWLSWEIDTDRGVARCAQGLTVPVEPFLGMTGLAPAAPGEHPLVTPHPAGGNLDCRALGQGSTIYLPVEVPEAYLYVGDGHAAQGDGEVSGTAIECGMRSTLRVDLVPAPVLSDLHAETPAGRVTFGLSTDLNVATETALAAMLGWIEQLHDVDRSTALALASVAVDLRVTQIASPVWGVHAVLPPTALQPSTGTG